MGSLEILASAILHLTDAARFFLGAWVPNNMRGTAVFASSALGCVLLIELGHGVSFSVLDSRTWVAGNRGV